MRVIHYIPSIGSSGGGVSAYLQLLSHDLGKLVDLHIICHHSENELKLEHCKIHYIENSIRRYFKMKREFCFLLDSIKPDIVHVNGCWMLQCSWTVFWAKAKGYSVALSPHGMLEPWDIKKNYWTKKLPALLLYQKRSVQISDILIATSESEKNNLLNLRYNQKIAIVPNGIRVDNIDCKTSWSENRRILFLALYRKNKGIDILMESVSQLKDELQGWKVTIAGIESDYTMSDLKEMARTLQIEDIIDIVGPLYGEDKWNAYKNADVFILPTLNENFGIVIAESYLCGTPVITTKGAPWRLIKDFNCGWWIERDVDKLSNAILAFLKTSTSERERMGCVSRQLIIDRFSSYIVAKEMFSLYQNL